MVQERAVLMQPAQLAQLLQQQVPALEPLLIIQQQLKRHRVMLSYMPL